MSYDWEEIFKKKTDKELFEIVIGKVSLSYEAEGIAIAELRKRGVDVGNIELQNKIWKLSNLVSENYHSKLFWRGPVYISFKVYLIIIIGVSSICYYLDNYTNTAISLELFLGVLGYITAVVVIGNNLYKKNEREDAKKLHEIEKLREELFADSSIENKEDLYNVLQKYERELNKEGNLVFVFTLLVIVLFIVLFGLIKVFV